MNKKALLSIASTACAVILLAACSFGPPTAATDTPPKTASFQYSSKPVTGTKANFAVAMFPPSYDKSFTYGGYSPFTTLQKSMGSDLEALMIAKGFTTRGPFKTLDDMVFSDKKQTDMVIEVKVDPQLNMSNGQWYTTFGSCGAGTSGQRYKGTWTLTFRVDLTGSEPQSNERLWRKTIEADQINVPVDGKKTFCSRDLSGLYQDAGVMDPLVDSLQVHYADLMDKVAKRIETEEFNSLKTQINEIKAKKGY